MKVILQVICKILYRWGMGQMNLVGRNYAYEERDKVSRQNKMVSSAIRLNVVSRLRLLLMSK
jgi:hypothetical protein